MDSKRRIRISKFMSKVLRHEPESIGLILGDGGWVTVVGLLDGLANAGTSLTREELEEIVRTCDKQRFAINESGTLIRANQGHSAEVDLQLEVCDPPAELFHGTALTAVPSILRDGLLKMARHHVHLSLNPEVAAKVGQRHGKPAVLIVNAAEMRAAGHVFYCSANGVWLVEHVPPQYLRV